MKNPPAHATTNDPAPALGRGLALLRQLETDGALSLERLAAVTGWPKSSVSRLLRSLELVGAVRREPATRRYQTLVRLVQAGPAEDRLAATWSDHAGPLAERLGQTLELHRFDGQGLVMIDRREPESAVVSVRARIGFHKSLDELDALTQTVLAFGLPQRRWPRKTMWAWLDGQRSKLTAERVQACVRDVRQHGTAIDLDINEFGVRRYALPACDAAGRLLAVLAIAQACSPSDRQPRNDFLEHLRQLRNAVAGPPLSHQAIQHTTQQES